MQPHQQIPASLSAKVRELFKKGATLGDLYGYEREDYEAVYAIGAGLYRQARFSDALKAFGFLVMNNPWDRRFLNAFAACLHMQGKYEEAITYYSCASLLDMCDPLPTFHTAECLMALDRFDEGKHALEIVVKQSEGEKYAVLKQRAQALLNARIAAEQDGTGPKSIPIQSGKPIPTIKDSSQAFTELSAHIATLTGTSSQTDLIQQLNELYRRGGNT